jgi:hypothetical protein
MNKLILGFLAFLLVLPLFIFAQPASVPESCTLKNDLSSIVPGCTANLPISATDSEHAICCLLDTITNVTNWIFYILTVIVVIMVIYGGFVIVTGAGNPDKLTSGRQILTFALIGLALALIAKFLPHIVMFFIGTK